MNNRTNLLRLTVDSEKAFTVLFEQLAARLIVYFSRFFLLKPDQAEARLETKHYPQLSTWLAQAVRGVFLGSKADGSLAPFDQQPGGPLIPLAPYPRLLWGLVAQAGALAKDQHRAMIQNALKDAPDVAARFLMLWDQGLSDVVTEMVVREQDLEQDIDKLGRYTATYDSPHNWVDPNGYTLSDRIWLTEQETRQKLDLYLQDAIRRGKGSQQISKEIVKFLKPGQYLPETNKPYGRTVSYNAMRLARTEIASAYNRADLESARANPFVEQYTPVLSHSHPKVDICDQMVYDGPYEVNDDSGRPPFHPQCALPGELITTSSGPIPIENIRLGDKVLTHTGQWNAVVLLHKNNYQGPIYEIETAHGKFCVTPNHPIWSDEQWIDASQLQIGQHLLHAKQGIGLDGVLAEAIDQPSHPHQVNSLALVARQMLGFIMPTPPIALNRYLQRNHSEIDGVGTDDVFSLEGDAKIVEDLPHAHFDECRDAVSPFIAESFLHDRQAGIRFLFRQRDLLRRLGVLARIYSSPLIKTTDGFFGLLRRLLAPPRLVLFPGISHALADRAHRNMIIVKNLPQGAVGYFKSLADLWCTKPLNPIPIIQQIVSELAVFMLNSQNVPLYDGQSMLFGMVRGGSFENFSANGARKIEGTHSSLLPLEPEMKGRMSGNMPVSRVANPAQAHFNYTAILSIRQFEYDGPVYNLTVEKDHSYVLNGFVAHNCLCHIAWIAPEDVESLIERLRVELKADFPDQFDRHGLMNLADRVRMTSKKWVPDLGVVGPARRVTTVLQPGTIVPTPVEQVAVIKDVSEALVNRSRKYTRPIKRAIAAIDKVHKDGNLPRCEIVTGHDKYIYGQFRPAARFNFLEKKSWPEINISNVENEGKGAMTTLHEIGHFIDYRGFGGPGYTKTSDQPILTGQGVLAEWWSAVLKSPEYQKLADLRANPPGVVNVNIGGEVVQHYVDESYIAYLMEPGEIWARSYAQFIAENAGDEVIKKALEEALLFLPYPKQWVDFTDIGTAIKHIFSGMGWM